VKRDPALTPLSHDHHQALHQALRLKRAGEEDLREVTAGALEFWREQGALHFRIEEEILLPAFARHADPGDERVVRVLVDHVWIRERMARLESDPSVAELHELGERLDAHVRHEERVLFPAIEEALQAGELAELGEAVAAAERAG
jgi:iron-sulfur cluster repair protein YtfE (RIC family)